MGRALVVSVYHIITENPSMDTDTLKTLKSCPSQFIMDNRFFPCRRMWTIPYYMARVLAPGTGIKFSFREAGFTGKFRWKEIQ